MVNYLEQLLSGEAWHRFNKLIIDNPYEGTVRFSCFEQEAMLSDTGEFVERDFGVLQFPFDLDEVFEVFNPATATGTGSYATGTEVRQLLYSYIMHQIIRRAGIHIQSDTLDASDNMFADGFTLEIGIVSETSDVRDAFLADASVGVAGDVDNTDTSDTVESSSLADPSADLDYTEVDDTFESDGATGIVIYADMVDDDDTLESDVTVV